MPAKSEVHAVSRAGSQRSAAETIIEYVRQIKREVFDLKSEILHDDKVAGIIVYESGNAVKSVSMVGVIVFKPRSVTVGYRKERDRLINRILVVFRAEANICMRIIAGRLFINGIYGNAIIRSRVIVPLLHQRSDVEVIYRSNCFAGIRRSDRAVIYDRRRNRGLIIPRERVFSPGGRNFTSGDLDGIAVPFKRRKTVLISYLSEVQSGVNDHGCIGKPGNSVESDKSPVLFGCINTAYTQITIRSI